MGAESSTLDDVHVHTPEILEPGRNLSPGIFIDPASDGETNIPLTLSREWLDVLVRVARRRRKTLHSKKEDVFTYMNGRGALPNIFMEKDNTGPLKVVTVTGVDNPAKVKRVLQASLKSSFYYVVTLQLSACSLTWKSMQIIAPEMKGFSHTVTWVDLSCNKLGQGLITDGTAPATDVGTVDVLSLMESMTSLRGLDLHSNVLTEKDVELIAPVLGGLTLLKHLDMSHNMLRERGVQLVGVVLNSLTKLTTLYLHDNECNPDQASVLIPALQKLPKLSDICVFDDAPVGGFQPALNSGESDSTRKETPQTSLRPSPQRHRTSSTNMDIAGNASPPRLPDVERGVFSATNGDRPVTATSSNDSPSSEKALSKTRRVPPRSAGSMVSFSVFGPLEIGEGSGSEREESDDPKGDRVGHGGAERRPQATRQHQRAGAPNIHIEGPQSPSTPPPPAGVYESGRYDIAPHVHQDPRNETKSRGMKQSRARSLKQGAESHGAMHHSVSWTSDKSDTEDGTTESSQTPAAVDPLMPSYAPSGHFDSHTAQDPFLFMQSPISGAASVLSRFGVTFELPTELTMAGAGDGASLGHSGVMGNPTVPAIARTLIPSLPRRLRKVNWKRLYSSYDHGISLQTCLRHIKGAQVTCMLVWDSMGHVFGGVALQAWCSSRHPGYYGTGESFVFSLEPKFMVYPWTQKNVYHQICGSDPDFIAFGGGGDGYALWLDGDFNRGASYRSETYGNQPLSDMVDFSCRGVEVWALG